MRIVIRSRYSAERGAVLRVAGGMSVFSVAPLFLALVLGAVNFESIGSAGDPVQAAKNLAATGKSQPAQQKQSPHQQRFEGQTALAEALSKAGILIDLEAGLCAVPANVLVRDELLEFLLVGPRGSAHESLFSTPVKPSLLNTALLALGAEPGENVRYIEPSGSPVVSKERPASRGRRQQSSGAASVVLPTGDGFNLYALWKEAGEVYFMRVEDLIRNLKSGRTMRRHAWVYLGSRFAQLGKGQPGQFVADREENLINIAFFGEGNTLLTAALADCREQTIWIANSWMLPKRGWPMLFLFSREPIAAAPAEWVAELEDPLAARLSALPNATEEQQD